MKVKEVLLTPDQEAFVRQAIESGWIARKEDAVREALSLWEERERTRAEILTAIDEAEASLASGEGRVVTRESMRELAADVKRRGRARLASEQQTARRWDNAARGRPIAIWMTLDTKWLREGGASRWADVLISRAVRGGRNMEGLAGLRSKRRW